MSNRHGSRSGPAPTPASGGPLSLDPDQLLDQVDALRNQVAALSHSLEHHERLATLGTIAALIAHEFNNVLTPVMSYAQMALAKPDDRELVTKALTKSVEGTERAAAIAAAILGFVRDDSPHLHTLSREIEGPQGGVPRGTGGATCPVRVTIEEALACLAREPQKDGIRLAIEMRGDLRAAVKPITLQHIVLNLVLNARNAMLPGGGELTIGAKRSATRPVPPSGSVTSLDDAVPDDADATDCSGTYNAHGWVVLEVRDSGRGMSPGQLSNLFKPFYTMGQRAEDRGGSAVDRRDRGAKPESAGTSSQRRRGGDRRGTGLGMTICKRLLADAGGFLWATSREGAGTCVTIVMPEAEVGE